MIFISRPCLLQEFASGLPLCTQARLLSRQLLLSYYPVLSTRSLLGSVLSIEEGAQDGTEAAGYAGSVPSKTLTGDRFAPHSSHPDLGQGSPCYQGDSW